MSTMDELRNMTGYRPLKTNCYEVSLHFCAPAAMLKEYVVLADNVEEAIKFAKSEAMKEYRTIYYGDNPKDNLYVVSVTLLASSVRLRDFSVTETEQTCVDPEVHGCGLPKKQMEER